MKKLLALTNKVPKNVSFIFSNYSFCLEHRIQRRGRLSKRNYNKRCEKPENSRIRSSHPPLSSKGSNFRGLIAKETPPPRNSGSRAPVFLKEENYLKPIF